MFIFPSGYVADEDELDAMRPTPHASEEEFYLEEAKRLKKA